MIRLVARSTVEEIVLRRADDKLKLTNTVIEGGKVIFLTVVDPQILSNRQLLDSACDTFESVKRCFHVVIIFVISLVSAFVITFVLSFVSAFVIMFVCIFVCS